MRRWNVVVGLIGSLLISGSASAQTVQGCSRPNEVSTALWNVLSADAQAAQCRMAGVASTYEERVRAVEVDQPLGPFDTSSIRSKRLVLTGLVTALVGVAVLGPWGQEYSILGDTFCVGKYSVEYGGCLARGKQALIGVGLLGGGATMVWLGLRVSVNTTMTSHVKAVSAKMVW